MRHIQVFIDHVGSQEKSGIKHSSEPLRLGECPGQTYYKNIDLSKLRLNTIDIIEPAEGPRHAMDANFIEQVLSASGKEWDLRNKALTQTQYEDLVATDRLVLERLHAINDEFFSVLSHDRCKLVENGADAHAFEKAAKISDLSGQLRLGIDQKLPFESYCLIASCVLYLKKYWNDEYTHLESHPKILTCFLKEFGLLETEADQFSDEQKTYIYRIMIVLEDCEFFSGARVSEDVLDHLYGLKAEYMNSELSQPGFSPINFFGPEMPGSYDQILEMDQFLKGIPNEHHFRELRGVVADEVTERISNYTTKELIRFLEVIGDKSQFKDLYSFASTRLTRQVMDLFSGTDRSDSFDSILQASKLLKEMRDKPRFNELIDIVEAKIGRYILNCEPKELLTFLRDVRDQPDLFPIDTRHITDGFIDANKVYYNELNSLIDDSRTNVITRSQARNLVNEQKTLLRAWTNKASTPRVKRNALTTFEKNSKKIVAKMDSSGFKVKRALSTVLTAGVTALTVVTCVAVGFTLGAAAGGSFGHVVGAFFGALKGAAIGLKVGLGVGTAATASLSAYGVNRSVFKSKKPKQFKYVMKQVKQQKNSLNTATPG